MAGEVYSWYPGGGEPTRLQLFRDKKVKVVAACDDSCLVVTDFGDLYRWKVKEYVPPPTPKKPKHQHPIPTVSPSLSAAHPPLSPSVHALLDGDGFGEAVLPEVKEVKVRPPKVSSRPKPQREMLLKQVTAVSNGGTHYHAITPLRASTDKAATGPEQTAAAAPKRRIDDSEIVTTGVTWATFIEGVGDSPYHAELNKALETAFQLGKSRHNFATSFDGGAPQKYTMVFTDGAHRRVGHTDDGNQSFIQVSAVLIWSINRAACISIFGSNQSFIQLNDAYGTTRPVSRLLNGGATFHCFSQLFYRFSLFFTVFYCIFHLFSLFLIDTEYSLKAAPKPFQRVRFDI